MAVSNIELFLEAEEDMENNDKTIAPDNSAEPVPNAQVPASTPPVAKEPEETEEENESSIIDDKLNTSLSFENGKQGLLVLNKLNKFAKVLGRPQISFEIGELKRQMQSRISLLTKDNYKDFDKWYKKDFNKSAKTIISKIKK